MSADDPGDLASDDGGRVPLVSPRLSDLDVYHLLIRLGEQTRPLSARCWSTAAATALTAASRVMRALASALYQANIRDKSRWKNDDEADFRPNR